LAALVLDPITVRLVYLIQDWHFVTPNRLTWLSFLVGVPGIVCFALGAMGYLFIVLEVVFFQLSLLIDYADGKLARLRECPTRFGALLDYVLHGPIIVPYMAALTFSGYSISGSNVYLLAGFLWFVPFILLYLLKYEVLTMGVDTRMKMVAAARTINNKLVAKLESFTARKRVLPFPSDNDIYVIVFGIAPLIGQILIGIYIAAAYFWVMYIAEVVLLFWREPRGLKE